jgi:hypothetical protein
MTYRQWLENAEFAFAVPFVVAHRMTQLGNRREVRRMTTEKYVAFVESWSAIGLEMLRQQQALSNIWWRVWLSGFAPVRRRAIANARRLRRARRHSPR